jgi:hypothetical protein
MIFVLIPLIPCVVAQDDETRNMGDSRDGAATRMWIPETGYQKIRVVAEDSMPPRFTLTLTREMPTPGWTIRIDSVDVDRENRRITVKATEEGPDGITSQVITPTEFQIPFGTVEPGSYFLELWTRRAEERPHQPAHALILLAA